ADSIAEEGIDYLRGLPDITVDVKTGLSPDELDAIISRYAGLIVRSATKVPKGLIDRGTNLRVIGRAGSGLDSIDVEHAQQKGIIVLNVPQALSVSVAEHTMCLILALCRHTPQAHASIRAGGWEKGKFKGAELYKKTLGILGLGGIGQMVAARAQGFGMQVIGYDNAFYSESFEQVIRQADILTIHVPLTPQTRHMIGEHEIAMMKDGVRIINCARGGIIDEAALYRALVSGKVAGAALDVFEQEPPAGNPLLTLDNVVITPHIGASTKEAQVSVGMTIAKKVAGILLSTGTTESVARP
ncbi:MAG: phosphoglycerate dehydrogenase, partial [Candidatus Latescibacteria bacterium]|nr:phosphoglycerate dehydrogenase [Candidatus Latescibacterota bacterium]